MFGQGTSICFSQNLIKLTTIKEGQLQVDPNKL